MVSDQNMYDSMNAHGRQAKRVKPEQRPARKRFNDYAKPRLAANPVNGRYWPTADEAWEMTVYRLSVMHRISEGSDIRGYWELVADLAIGVVAAYLDE